LAAKIVAFIVPATRAQDRPLRIQASAQEASVASGLAANQSTEGARPLAGIAPEPPGTMRAANKPTNSPTTRALGTAAKYWIAQPAAVTRMATAILFGEFRLQSMVLMDS